jgi:serine protease Do
VDCYEFDGQVVRLEQIKDAAERFVRVRLTRIESLDLNLFEFDYDLTFMVFFLDAHEKVYARYGGRDGKDADNRQSLAGLRYTMQSVLRMHEREEKEFAPKSQDAAKFIRDVAGSRGFFGRGGCMHCHQVRERLDADLRRSSKWSRDMVFRYPLPENLGFTLEVDRGNVIAKVKDKSSASAAGLDVGDIVQRLGGVPIHSFADAQYALDRAAKAGSIDIVWRRGDKSLKASMPLSEGWRKSEIAWRNSLRNLIPWPRLNGKDLTLEEKKALGLSPQQLAFRQKDYVSPRLKEAGIRGGDIIVGVDGQSLETDFEGFSRHVENNYLVGDRIKLSLFRDGKRMEVSMTLQR